MARRNKGAEKSIAHERVERLVDLARDALRKEDQVLARRYGDLAWTLKTTYQLRGSAVESHVCRACHAVLVPGLSSRVRLTRGKRTTTCLACGHVRRRPLAPRVHASS